MQNNEMRSVDLFSGAGGLAEGFFRSGIRSVVATDWDLMAAKTFRHNHASVPFIQKDLAQLTSKELLDAAAINKGQVDIVAGGPPCQGFSLAGQRLTNDPRNMMFKEFVRVVREVEPRCFLFENVVGIKSMQQGRVLEAILNAFSEIGYNVEWRVVDSSDYGVPQSRPRLIILGGAENYLDFPSPTHGEPNTQSNLFSESWTPKITVWDAISDLPWIEQGQGDEEQNHSGKYNNTYQKDRRGIRVPGSLYNHRATKHSTAIQERYRLIPEGGNNVGLPEHLRTKKTNVYKLDRNKPARTVTCNHRTDLLHPIIPRGTTVREAARLQSFDDDYRFFGNLTRKAAWVTQDDQVGNAVPPLLAEAFGRSLVDQLNFNKLAFKNAC